jgi:hypothetical protein
MSILLSKTYGLGSVKSVKHRNSSKSQLKLPLMTYSEFIRLTVLKNVPKRLYGLKYGTYLSKNRS